MASGLQSRQARTPPHPEDLLLYSTGRNRCVKLPPHIGVALVHNLNDTAVLSLLPKVVTVIKPGRGRPEIAFRCSSHFAVLGLFATRKSRIWF